MSNTCDRLRELPSDDAIAPAIPCMQAARMAIGQGVGCCLILNPDWQVSAALAVQHRSKLTHEAAVDHTMRHLCNNCWLNGSWMPTMRLFQVWAHVCA